MSSSLFRLRPVLSLGAVIVAAQAMSACSAPSLTVEVLPPRTSVACSSPSVNSAAFGRGLLDVNATTNGHGSYVEDLRFTAHTDAQIAGVTLSYTLPDGSNADVKSAADTASAKEVAGNVALAGKSDDVRQAVVENVQLVPRELALALQKDTDLGLDATTFKTLTVTLTPAGSFDGSVGDPTVFALDLCKGCLVDAPSAEQCPGGATTNSAVCRVGQDISSFTCVPTTVPAGGAP
jgi:hypothetical protein